MEPTLEQLSAKVAELESKLAESESGRKHLLEFFDERLEEETQKRATELAEQKQEERKVSVSQQFREAASLPNPQTLSEYSQLRLADKVRLLERHGEGYLHELARRQRVADEAAKRAAILEQMAKKNPKL